MKKFQKRLRSIDETLEGYSCACEGCWCRCGTCNITYDNNASEVDDRDDDNDGEIANPNLLLFAK